MFLLKQSKFTMSSVIIKRVSFGSVLALESRGGETGVRRGRVGGKTHCQPRNLSKVFKILTSVGSLPLLNLTLVCFEYYDIILLSLGSSDRHIHG